MVEEGGGEVGCEKGSEAGGEVEGVYSFFSLNLVQEGAGGGFGGDGMAGVVGGFSFGGVVAEGGGDDAGAGGEDADGVGFELGVERTGERVDEGLRGAVDGVEGEGEVGGVGGDVEDGAGAVGLLEVARGFEGELEEGLAIDAEDAEVVFSGVGEGVAQIAEAGVVDEEVDVKVFDVINESLAIVCIGEVAGEGLGLEGVGEVLEGVCIAAGEEKGDALPREGVG